MAVDRKLLARAVAELGITVPVLRVEVEGDGLKLWLYGRGDKPVTWTPKAQPGKVEPKSARPESKQKKVKRET